MQSNESDTIVIGDDDGGHIHTPAALIRWEKTDGYSLQIDALEPAGFVPAGSRSGRGIQLELPNGARVTVTIDEPEIITWVEVFDKNQSAETLPLLEF